MSNNNIIKIEPAPEKYFSITWMLGSYCNYECMYCPSELHDKTSKHKSLDELKTAWEQIYNKSKNLNLPYKISFTGGECTTNKNFLPFLEWLDKKPTTIKIYFTTNGSAGMKYYTRVAKLVSGISFSTHSEYMDEKSFFEKALYLNQIMIRPEKSFHVNIMNEYWNEDRINLYIAYLENHNISYSLNKIDYNQKVKIYPESKGKQNIEKLENF